MANPDMGEEHMQEISNKLNSVSGSIDPPLERCAALPPSRSHTAPVEAR